MIRTKQTEAPAREEPSPTAENPTHAAPASETCPQGSDCAGNGEPAKVLDCEQGCGFRACAACMRIHEEEPHVGDSDHMLAMIRDIGGPW